MKANLKRKGSVEIYFVLYLAALIFLLPGKDDEIRDEESMEVQSIAREFVLNVEKTTLNCTVTGNPGHYKIFSIDSVNTIFYSGNAQNIVFEFSVEDQSINRNIVLKSDERSSTKYFRIREIGGQSAAEFHWKPPLDEKVNKTYIVNVTATGMIRISNEKQRKINAKTRFSLNVIHLNDETGQSFSTIDSLTASPDIVIDNQAPTGLNQTAVYPVGEVNLRPWAVSLKALASRRWSNQVWVSGINLKKQLKGFPKTEVIQTKENNGGSAIISDFTENTISLSGITPFTGNIKVLVSFIRNADNKEFTTEFNVIPARLSKPLFDPILYPGIEYSIETNLPFLQDKETLAKLTQGSRVVSKTERGKLNFTPQLADTGKRFVLTRLVDNETIDSYNIEVQDFSGPEIVRTWKISENKIRIATRSYGKLRGADNFCKIELSSGKGVVREKFGHDQKDADKFIWLQFFEITVDENFSGVIEFIAVDSRGRKSAVKDYKF